MARGSPKTRNGGQWSEARFVSFVKSALRGARWGPKYACIRKAYVRDGINPRTGHKCKLHLCPVCKQLFPQNMMKADHIVPVVGKEGFTTWDDFIKRLFVEVDGFQAMCKGCHQIRTNEQTQERVLHRKSKIQP